MMTRSAFPAALAFAAALSYPAAPAPAQSGPGSPVLNVEIVPGWTERDGTRIAALRIQLQPGWHTYWRIPGEAGIAPRFDWSRSQNVASITPIWPRPVVFDQNGMESFGYEDELVLPIAIRPRIADRPVAVMGALAIGVCRDTCVPVDLSVQAALRGAGGPDPRIQAALDTAARPGEGAGLTRATCHLEPAQRGANLTLRATLPRTGHQEHIIVELPGTGYWVSDSHTWREGGDLVAEARVRAPAHAPVSIDRASLAFTVLSEGRMLTARGCQGG